MSSGEDAGSRGPRIRLPLRARFDRPATLAFPVCALGAYLCAALPAGTRGSGYLLLCATLTALQLIAFANPDVSPGRTRRLVAAGMLARLALVFVPPFTTHDVQRYLWDGRVLWEGLDPWALAPNDPALAFLRPAWVAPPELAMVRSVYPPGALALFALSSAFGPLVGAWVWKLLVTAASMGALALGARALGRLGGLRGLPLLALSPLLVLESGVGAHVDVLASLGLVAALLLRARAQDLLAGVALAAGALCKPVVLGAALPLALYGPPRRSLRLLGGVALGVGAGVGVPLALGRRVIGELPMFFERWRFGAVVFPYLEPGRTSADALAVTAIAGVTATVVAVLLLRRSRAAVAVAVATPLAFSPVVFPWYLAPAAAAVAFSPSATWIAWLAVAPATYESIDLLDRSRLWQPAAWPLELARAALACGLALDLALALARWRRRA